MRRIPRLVARRASRSTIAHLATRVHHLQAIDYYKKLKCIFDAVLPLWKQAIGHVGALGTSEAVAWVAPEYETFTDCDPT